MKSFNSIIPKNMTSLDFFNGISDFTFTSPLTGTVFSGEKGKTMLYYFLSLLIVMFLYNLFNSRKLCSGNPSSFYQLIFKNFKFGETRPISTLQEVKRDYLNKYLNIQHHFIQGGYPELNCSRERKNVSGKYAYISHKGFRKIEFAIAELCIILAHNITLTKDEYLNNIKQIYILTLIDKYISLFKTPSPETCLSLFLRILKQLCYIEKVNIFAITSVLTNLFNKKYSVKFETFYAAMQGNENIFEYESCWDFDTQISRKKLKDLTLYISVIL